ncbi:MAG: flagellar basal-body rod protein FlgF [Rhizomicrobium sp.]|jgi:flagellar basal-body rod protein FlgF
MRFSRPRETQRFSRFLHGTSAAAGDAGAQDQKGPGRAMNQTMLVSLSQQLATYQAMDSIANNIANVSTPAYKRETPTFQEYVAKVQPAEGDKGSKSVSYVQETGAVRDLKEGPMETTGGKFDFAIHGNGYFAVQTANGERYTRNGHFTLDLNGKLSTEEGDQVETQGGPLSITPQDGDVNVAADGTVSATINGTQSQLGKLKVVSFANERALQKEGDSLYSTTQTANPATNVKVVQGMLEASNVQPVIEISNMIEIMRTYQATSNLSQTQHSQDMQSIDKLAQVQD